MAELITKPDLPDVHDERREFNRSKLNIFKCSVATQDAVGISVSVKGSITIHTETNQLGFVKLRDEDVERFSTQFSRAVEISKQVKLLNKLTGRD